MTTGKAGRGLLLLGVLALVSGCNNSSESASSVGERQPSTLSPSSLAPRASSPDGPLPVEAPVKISGVQTLPGLSAEDAAAVVHTPVVFLSGKHQSTCLRGVGDRFPPVEMTTIAGEPTVLEESRGQRLTVVVFWSLQYPPSLEQIARINSEVVERFGKTGVEVVTVNVGDTREDVQAYLEQIELDAINLLDANGDGFAQVASGMLPRTYLLDSAGTIKWFDIEYSRSTRRELRNAIIYNLRMQAEDDQVDSDPLM